MLGSGRHSTTANGPCGSVPVTVTARAATSRAAAAPSRWQPAAPRRVSPAMRCDAAGERAGVEVAGIQPGTDPGRDRLGRLGIEVRPEAQEVGAGGQRQHRGVGDAVGAPPTGDRLHVERVGDHHAVEAQHPTKVTRPRGAERHGRVVERVGHDVGREDGIDAGRDRSRERHQLARCQHVERRGDARRAEVGVGARVAMAREVLGAGRHPAGVEAVERGDDVPGDELRRRAERAHADHRVARIGVDVGDRGEREIDAQLGEALTEAGARRRRQVGVVDEPERRRARRVAAPRRVEAGDVAALLVDRDHDVGTGRLQLGAQRRHLPIVDHVLGEQQHTAEAVTHEVEQPRRGLGRGERPEQHAERQAAAHPITPVAAHPDPIDARLPGRRPAVRLSSLRSLIPSPPRRSAR